MSDGPLFELKIAGRMGVAKAPAPPASLTESRRRQVEDGRQSVQPYVEEALFVLVSLMRQSSDEGLKYRCAMSLLDRAWGKPKPLPPDDPGALGNGNSIIDLLAAASKYAQDQGMLPQEPAGPSQLPAAEVVDVKPRASGHKLEPIEIVPETVEDAEFINMLNEVVKGD